MYARSWFIPKSFRSSRNNEPEDYWEDEEGIYMVMPYSKKDSLIELLATTIDQKGSIEVELIGTIIF